MKRYITSTIFVIWFILSKNYFGFELTVVIALGLILAGIVELIDRQNQDVVVEVIEEYKDHKRNPLRGGDQK